MNTSYLAFVLKRLALLELIIVGGVLVLCWIAGWHTVNEISMALLVVGAIIFSIGPFAMMGSWGNTRNWSYLYIQSMREENAADRLRQDRLDHANTMGLMGPSLVIGTLTMILSTVIQTAFH